MTSSPSSESLTASRPNVTDATPRYAYASRGKNDTSDSYNRRPIVSRIWSIDRNDLEWPLTRISRSVSHTSIRR